MNRKILIAAMLIAVMSMIMSGCTDTELYGTYISENDSDSFLKLNENGVYLLKESGAAYIDHFEYDDDSVYLAAMLGAVELERNSSKVLVDTDGERWVRK